MLHKWKVARAMITTEGTIIAFIIWMPPSIHIEFIHTYSYMGLHSVMYYQATLIFTISFADCSTVMSGIQNPLGWNAFSISYNLVPTWLKLSNKIKKTCIWSFSVYPGKKVLFCMLCLCWRWKWYTARWLRNLGLLNSSQSLSHWAIAPSFWRYGIWIYIYHDTQQYELSCPYGDKTIIYCVWM